jgi:hypothetical protein
MSLLEQRPMIGRKEMVKMRSFRVFLSVLFVVSVLGFTSCATEMVNKDDPTVKSTDPATVKKKASESNQSADMPGT